MAGGPRLELRQGQSLVMTPQLQQAIKLLQLSNMELAAYVEEELERNPLLERDEGQNDQTVANGALEPPQPPEPPAPDVAIEDAPGLDSMEQAESQTLPEASEAPLDTDYENVYGEDSSAPGPSDYSAPAGKSGSFDDEGYSLEQRLSEEVSLRQHLLDQLQIEMPDPVDRIIGVHLIDMIDASGYLPENLEQLSDLLGCDAERVETALAGLQKFDPPGIFARSLRECLALQLADLNRLDPAMEALLDNLDLLAKGDLAGLKKRCAVDQEDLVEMIAELKALDPKPAQAFEVELAEPVVPDILMRPTPSGEWILELNSDMLPKVLVNNQYFATVAPKATSKADKEYLNECFQSANWLVRSLHQRATTILKVTAEIVRQQDAFFRKGVQHLKPLILKDVAEIIEMHESTVSRVTSNKYVATPRGTYELKYFFSSSVSGTDGSAHSAEAVRHRIKSLIDGENAKKILSDDRIVDLLREEGVEIARRTVAKYRESMRIPSSVQRRREKAASL